jgi:hypothetical protein
MPSRNGSREVGLVDDEVCQEEKERCCQSAK